ncbi:hypothetical protein C8Q73DRAFT_520057 [Cubamyces lactineus]|nr:hypothetical protein C8Q73DRAFT_520057 [Cubamyces lactineus]
MSPLRRMLCLSEPKERNVRQRRLYETGFAHSRPVLSSCFLPDEQLESRGVSERMRRLSLRLPTAAGPGGFSSSPHRRGPASEACTAFAPWRRGRGCPFFDPRPRPASLRSRNSVLLGGGCSGDACSTVAPPALHSRRPRFRRCGMVQVQGFARALHSFRSNPETGQWRHSYVGFLVLCSLGWEFGSECCGLCYRTYTAGRRSKVDGPEADNNIILPSAALTAPNGSPDGPNAAPRRVPIDY